jgi:hypothetical protein
VIADEGVAAGRRLIQFERHELADLVAQRPGQHCNSGAGRAKLRLDLATVAAKSDLGFRQHPSQPKRIGHVLEIGVHCDEPQTASVSGARALAAFETIQRVRNVHEASRDHLGLVKGLDAKDEVGLPPRQIVEPGVGQQLHHDLGMEDAEFSNDGRQHVGAEPVRTGNAQQTRELVLDPGQASLKRQCLFFDALRMAQGRIPFVGQHKTFNRSLEERMANRSFERTKSPSHGRLGLADLARGGAKRALASNRQKNTKVAPFHWPVSRASYKIV